MDRRPFAVSLLALGLVGCSGCRRTVPVAPPASAAPTSRASYIDLQAGWRLSVVTPLLKSGGYRLDPTNKQPATLTATEGAGNKFEATITAGDDFLGYERSVYSVMPRGDGVRVQFTSAETVREGKTVSTLQRPVAPLFTGIPGRARHVRLVFLLRSSTNDHEMAIVAARQRTALESIQRAITADPVSGCSQAKALGGICHWVPAGIAVRPERPKPGTQDWVPAR